MAGRAPRGRTRGADPDSPVTRGRRRRIPPIVEDEEVDSDATIIPSPQSMADSPELNLAPPPLPATPVRRRPNVRYAKRKLALDPPAPRGPKKRKLPPWMVALNQEAQANKRKGPNVKYTKRKSPPKKKKSPPKRKKKSP